MHDDKDFAWVFHTALREQTESFMELVETVAPDFAAHLSAAAADTGLVCRAEFPGAGGEDPEDIEARGRAFWLELHSRCLDQNLALELVEHFVPSGGWQAWDEAAPPVAPPAALVPAPPPPAQGLALVRPPIAAEPLYDILRADDPDMDRNLEETIAWIEDAGMPVINLLSYLELPLFQHYAEEHPEERDQNLFLHMLHTWACYRRFGAVHARASRELAAAFEDPRYLRLNTTQFRSPAPALCVQFADWTQPVRGLGGNSAQWAKEVYLTHFEPPNPSEDRELTLMTVVYDERGEFGFIPLEVPLSMPAVGESIDAFFAPSAGDEELGANTEDLRRLTSIAATYCLYATARDPAHYLQA